MSDNPEKIESVDLYADITDDDLWYENEAGLKEDMLDLFDHAIRSTTPNKSSGNGGATVELTEPETEVQKTEEESPDDEKIAPEQDKPVSPAQGDKEDEDKVVVQVLVGNLSWWTTDEDVIAACNSIGVEDVVQVRFRENRATGQSKGYCVVTLGSAKSLQSLREHLPSILIHDREPVVRPMEKQAFLQFERQFRDGLILPPSPPNCCNCQGDWAMFQDYPTEFEDNLVDSAEAMLTQPSTSEQGAMESNHPNLGNVDESGATQAGVDQPMQVNEPSDEYSGNPDSSGPGNWIPPLAPCCSADQEAAEDGTPPENGSLANEAGARGFSTTGLSSTWNRADGRPGHSHNTHGQWRHDERSAYSRRTHFDRKQRREEEFDKILRQNRTMTYSAISRARTDLRAGDFESAVDTLETAISLIKQSRAASHDRCKAMVGSLQETMREIEMEAREERAHRDRERHHHRRHWEEHRRGRSEMSQSRYWDYDGTHRDRHREDFDSFESHREFGRAHYEREGRYRERERSVHTTSSGFFRRSRGGGRGRGHHYFKSGPSHQNAIYYVSRY